MMINTMNYSTSFSALMLNNWSSLQKVLQQQLPNVYKTGHHPNLELQLKLIEKHNIYHRVLQRQAELLPAMPSRIGYSQSIVEESSAILRHCMRCHRQLCV